MPQTKNLFNKYEPKNFSVLYLAVQLKKMPITNKIGKIFP